MTTNDVPALDLSGKTIVVTGASSGLGASAAASLAARGANLAVVGRNPERTTAVARVVNGTAFFADFDHLDQVHRLAAELLARYDRIDVLANNAGGLVKKRVVTSDGFERTFQANHLAPFLLTHLLMPVLEKSQSRVISTASVANLSGRIDLDDPNFERRGWFSGWPAYGTSKLMNILFIEELAKRTGLEAFSFHPGYVTTGFGAESMIVRFVNTVSGGKVGLRPDEGAAPLVHLASVRDVGVPSGTYFDRLSPYGRVHKLPQHAEISRQLWDTSAELVRI
ncbi:MAG: SDR family NAD(P)-dependent oxidoreductase [Lacisediminihabitans sp.]